MTEDPFAPYFQTTELDEDESFLIQDPFGVREVVQPIISIPEDGGNDTQITGIGTCFQISPWSWMTAQHALEYDDENTFPPGEVGAVGFSPGLVFGTFGFYGPDIFAPIRQTFSIKAQEGQIDPRTGREPPKMMSDMSVLYVDTSLIKREGKISPLPISNEPVKIGDKLLAVGFPILGTKFTSDKQVFEERMHGARCVVTELYPKGRGDSQQWPCIQVEGNIKSGMSGGPVINAKGEVVGIVSSSFPSTEDGPGTGFFINLTSIDLSMIAPEVYRAKCLTSAPMAQIWA